MTATTQTPTYAASAAGAERLAADIKRRWRGGEHPDAATALAAHPELLAFKSVVVELAYEEYCLREEADAAPELGPFCARMPAFRGSIRKVVEAHRMLVEHPEVLTPEPAWPEPGDRIDGLEVVAELGRGTFARAYLAFDPQTDRGCVLKLSPGRGGEGRALGPLHHPHITDVYWADRICGMTAVCMPLLGVSTLDDVREAAFPAGGTVPRTATALLGAIQDAPGAAAVSPVAAAGESHAVAVAAVAARVADALAYLHRHGREHGDLKPSNVVLAPGGHPYLIDFNLAGDGEAAGVGGTVPYMAPERLAALVGSPADTADRAKADVYSFGCVIYEMLTGRLPWPPNPQLGPIGAAAELLDRRRAGVEWPEGTDIPDAVARLVEACLADTPADRPAAADAATTLSRWLAAERGEGVRPTRRRVYPAVWATGIAAAVLAAAAVLWPGRQHAAGSAVAEAPPAAAPEPPAKLQLPADPFRRGLILLANGDAAKALYEFHTAGQAGPNRARALAYQSYCLARTGPYCEHQKDTVAHINAAINIGKQARDEGADCAAVNNNIGYAYIEKRLFAQAVRHLDVAVNQAPELAAARFNRADARFELMLKDCEQRKLDPPQFTDLAAADDILEALQRPSESPEFYAQAARILAASSPLNSDLRPLAIRCMADAVRVGRSTRLARDPLLRKYLEGLEGYGEFPHPPPATTPRPSNEFRLVEPIQP